MKIDSTVFLAGEREPILTVPYLPRGDLPARDRPRSTAIRALKPDSAERLGRRGAAHPGALPLHAVATASLIALSGPPFNLPLAAWVAFAPLLWGLRSASVRAAAAAGLLCGTLVFAAIAYGVAFYDARLAIAVPAIGGLLFAGFGVLARIVLRHARPWVRVLGPALLWTAVEWLCTLPVPSLPATFGVALAGSPALPLASVVGVHGLSFLLVLSAAALAEAGGGLARERRPAAALLGAAPMLLALLAGSLIAGAQPAGAASGVRFRAIQPAIPFDRTHDSWWRPDLRSQIRRVFEDEVRLAAASEAALVLWPEGGAMLSGFRPAQTRAWLPQLLAGDRTYLITASDVAPSGERRNRVLAFDGARRPLVYQKRRLVPLAERAYEAGQGDSVLRTSAAAVGSLICFEVCFPDAARRLVEDGAELLFASTNDAAFGDTALPLWHRATAALRAAETRTPVLFVSNRGPSAHFDARGRIASELEMARPGALEGIARAAGTPSAYVRFGHRLAWLAIPGALLVLGLGVRSSADRPQHAPTPRAWLVGGGAGALAVAALIGAGSAWVTQMSGDARAYAGTGSVALDDFLQRQSNTCGVAALSYMASTLGEPTSQARIRGLVRLTAEGTTLLDLRNAARALGYAASGREWSYDRLQAAAVPVIAHLSDLHYLVVLAARGEQLLVFDPARGLGMRDRTAFLRQWSGYVLELRTAESTG